LFKDDTGNVIGDNDLRFVPDFAFNIGDGGFFLSVESDHEGGIVNYHEMVARPLDVFDPDLPLLTSGNIDLNGFQAGISRLRPTGNCNITSFFGFNAGPADVSEDPFGIVKSETVVFIIDQGSTGYTVTLPSGADYMYAGNVRSVSSTANSVTMLSVTAIGIAGYGVKHLISVSPEFV
jgi:hypothetical protein